ncbi:MAG TPA: methyltransferase domain-containing protein [Solirubrobacteraceae bacterium]|nr:methyltransferase domain-containing protein [Solirubrobacteraceae bacterium]
MEPSTPACPFCGGASRFALTARDRNRESTDARFSYERCVQCGTLFMRDVPDDLAPFYAGEYHRFTPDGAAEWEGNETLRAVETARVAMLAEHALSSPGGRLIDIGAGPGAFAAAAKHAGYEVSAIEMDERSCDYMERRLGVRAIRSDEPIAALAELPPARVISMWHVLEHLRDPAAMLATAADRLEAGGVLAIGVPNPGSLQFRLLRARWAHLDAPRHLCFVPAPAMIERARELGLRPLYATSEDLFSRLCALHGWIYALRPRPARGDARPVTVRAAQAVTKALVPLERRELRGPALTLLFIRDRAG